MRQPSLFIPHGGGPCFFMKWTMGPEDTWEKTRAFLEGIPASLPERPKAILVISGHWEEPVPTASTATDPQLIFDYYGFPPETYRLTWPAPGAPEVALRAWELLNGAGQTAARDSRRGFDHGVFIPLKVAFPGAEIPTVALSLDASLDAGRHLAIGRALAPLRDEGVLIVGSGMSFHNLRAYYAGETLARSEQFDRWLGEAVESPVEERNRRLARWEEAPYARYAHPRSEHLLPLMVAAGAGGDATGRRVFRDAPMDAVISGFRWD